MTAISASTSQRHNGTKNAVAYIADSKLDQHIPNETGGEREGGERGRQQRNGLIMPPLDDAKLSTRCLVRARGRALMIYIYIYIYILLWSTKIGC